MVQRKITWFLCLALLLFVSSSGIARQAAADTQPHPATSNEINTLNNDKQLTDINDIKPLEKIGLNPRLFGYVALGAMVVALMAVVFMYLKKRKKKVLEITASISPEETALNRLDELHALKDSDGKKFYFTLSKILREYIWQRFGVGAPEMTTEELLPRMAELRIDQGLFQGVREFARSSDPVKFAERPAEMETMERHLEFVRSFVKQTTPAVEINAETPQLGNETVKMELMKS